MVSIIPLETNFPWSPSFEGPILHASHLGLTPALPKALQNLLHGVYTSVQYGLLCEPSSITVMLGSPSNWSSVDQSVFFWALTIWYCIYLLFHLCVCVLFFFSYLSVCFRKTATCFLFPEPSIVSAHIGAFVAWMNLILGRRIPLLITGWLPHSENTTVRFRLVCSGVFSATSPEIILMNICWLTMS